eukprot:10566185-Heterocapsa_arctica.AAC.1
MPMVLRLSKANLLVLFKFLPKFGGGLSSRKTVGSDVAPPPVAAPDTPVPHHMPSTPISMPSAPVP